MICLGRAAAGVPSHKPSLRKAVEMSSYKGRSTKSRKPDLTSPLAFHRSQVASTTLQEQGHRLMENLRRLPDELLNGGGLLHVAASSGHQTARIALIQTTSSGVFVPALARWPAAYGHRLTRRQRRLSINIPPELNEGRKALRLRCGRQTPTVLAWLAPSIIGTGVMPCAIITVAAYGKFSCPVLVQVSYSSSRASKARSSRDSESQHSVRRRPF
jgi:hypothetical protein